MGGRAQVCWLASAGKWGCKMQFDIPPLHFISFIALVLFLVTGMFVAILDMIRSPAARILFALSVITVFCALAWAVFQSGG